MPDKRVTGEQSRRMSLVEAIINVVIGYVIAVVTNWLVLPLFGFAVSMGDSAAIGASFTGVALVRSYLLRRLFEAIRVRRVQKRQPPGTKARRRCKGSWLMLIRPP